MFTISIGLRSGWRQCFASQKKASLGLFWPAHPLQIASCISLSLVFKHRQVVCPCGARPQVILFLWAQTQCFLCAQVCQIVLQGWDWENATLSLFALMCQVRSHPYRRVFVWLCQYYSLTPLLQMAFRWHSLRAAIEDYRPVSNSVACRVECDPQNICANILRTIWLHL